MTLFALAALTETPAHAFWYNGNPVLDFRVDRPAGDYLYGAVTLTKIRVNHCGGGYTDYAYNTSIDPVQLHTLNLGSGNECTVQFYWGSTLDVTGSGFLVRYSQSITTVNIDTTDIAPVALTPYSVVSGSMSGGSPWLLTNIE